MKKNESIAKVMSTSLRTINLQTKLSETRAMFSELGVHHLPVVEGERLIGMLSYSDFLRIDSGDLYNQDSKQADVLLDNLSSVKEVMTKNLKTINTTTSVREATKMLVNENFHSLPVTDEGDHLKGIITTTDLLNYYLNNY